MAATGCGRARRQGDGRRARGGAIAALALAASIGAAGAARAADPAACANVRLSDVGWTDITATTALTAQVLEGLGYRARVEVIAVPVTFKSLASGDIDVFLGNWMPTQTQDVAPYTDKGEIDVVGPNLEGAKYTLAVPKYLADQGLTSFDKIKDFKTQLAGKIYGIEPGNDGNRLIQGMIDQDQFGLRGFQLVESSEQGMLAQVARLTPGQEPIVFLGWEPHPMNARFPMTYLTGGDDVFGPNFGGATVFTVTRKGYAQACPNLGKLLANLKFTLPLENQAMGLAPEAAAKKYLTANPQVLDAWLAGVTTLEGAPGLAAVKDQLGL